MRLILPMSRRDRQLAGDLRCCDLAMIGVLLAIAAGFIFQGIVWLAM